MGKEYDVQDKEPQMVNEPVLAYGYSATTRHLHRTMEMSNSEKKEYLRANLHHSTIEFLESVDWMENKPYPMYSDVDDDAWIDEAEAMQGTDIVDDAQILKDRQAWFSLS